MKKTITLLSLAFLAACGKEVGRVPFAAEGSAESTVPLAAGEVAFWTDLDIKYEGAAKLTYEVELLQGGAVVATASCDPLGPMNVKKGWVELNVGDDHSRRGSGKMSCAAEVPAAGPTVVRAKLAFQQKPASVTLTRADLALKQ